MHKILEFQKRNLLSYITAVCLGRNFLFLKHPMLDHVTETLYMLSPLVEHLSPYN